ncbi:hypothetical protein BC834DRAFT_890034 [Gloeopeniophorella convolvens]|nr:hypothetical protein BC834DRAFT_890034 [Gloeopeniophorella convolvens]
MQGLLNQGPPPFDIRTYPQPGVHRRETAPRCHPVLPERHTRRFPGPRLGYPGSPRPSAAPVASRVDPPRAIYTGATQYSCPAITLLPRQTRFPQEVIVPGPTDPTTYSERL